MQGDKLQIWIKKYRVILVTRNYYNRTKLKKDVLYLYKCGQIRGANINNFNLITFSNTLYVVYYY